MKMKEETKNIREHLFIRNRMWGPWGRNSNKTRPYEKRFLHLTANEYREEKGRG